MHTISYRLAALATVLAAVAAFAGLAVTGLYVDSPNWVQQAQGTDLATLFLAVPVLVLGLWTASRGSSAGRLAVVAGLLYLVYNYAIFAFSVALNPLTAVHIAIFGLSLWSLLLAGRSAVEGAESVTGSLNRRAAAALLIGVATMFGLLWLAQIATVATTGVLPPDLVEGRHLQQPGLRARSRLLPASVRDRRHRPFAAQRCGGLRLPDACVGSADGCGRRRRHRVDGGGR